MNDLIAYCGLDCNKCEARIATLNNDDKLREKTAREWSEMNSANILPEMINCTGCRVEGEKFQFCELLCPIRKCAMDEGVETCGSCPKMDLCEKLGMVTENNPEALENLRGANK